jgi:hypothetical protein
MRLAKYPSTIGDALILSADGHAFNIRLSGESPRSLITGV